MGPLGSSLQHLLAPGLQSFGDDSVSFLLLLAADTQLCIGHGHEPTKIDRAGAYSAYTVGALFDTVQSLVDGMEQPSLVEIELKGILPIKMI